jgi:hypothetical protein
VTTAATAEAARWLRALETFVAVPAAHAEPTISAESACTFLRCSQETLAELLDAGLPAYDGRCDRFDLVNLALRSASGASIPEVSLRQSFRFVTKDVRQWCEPRRWRVELDLRCAPGAHGGVHEWTAWTPLPWPDTAESTPTVERFAGARVEVRWEVRTAGCDAPLVSPTLRELVHDYVGERDFAQMPLAVQADGDWMEQRRIFDCLSGSTALQRRCADAGIASRVRQGWLGGLIASPHAWLEAEDADGCWKTVDPAFHALSLRLYPACVAFHAFCLGSRLNRLIATHCPPGEACVAHACASDAQAEIHVAIRDADRSGPCA